jgi:hypothetical protein
MLAMLISISALFAETQEKEGAREPFVKGFRVFTCLPEWFFCLVVGGGPLPV